METLEALFFAAVAVLIVNYVVGVLQEYYPEALPTNLRKKEIEMKDFLTRITYNSAWGIKTNSELMTANSLERMEYAVMDELNKKKFISLRGGLIIPTNAIVQVQILEKPEKPEEAGE